MFRVIIAVLCGLLFPTLAVAEPRLALVIGNSNYGPDIGQLTNPANDADLIGEALQRRGFNVVVAKDVDQKAMKRVLSDFSKRLTSAGPGSTALFYYAGHGVQVGGTNYLIPINASIASEGDVEFEAVEADSVLRQIEYGGSRVSIVILDACRNNPLARSLRAATRGLARMEAPSGSFVAYSTAPGQTAADGTGRNSPFAAAFAEEVQKPGAAIEETFRNVRAKVIEATNNEQVPWDSSSLTAPFYFSEPQVASVAPAQQPAAAPAASNATEVVFWESIKTSSDPADFEAYLKKYPNGDFVDLARNKINTLKSASQQQAAIQPAAPAPSATSVDPNALDMAYWNSVKDSRSATDFEAYLKKFPNGEFADLAKSRIGALRSVTPPAAAATAPAAEPEPEFESPLADGTIVLSPAVAAKLAEYMNAPAVKAGRTEQPAYFYVSEDGRDAGLFICPEKCGHTTGWMANTATRAKEKAKSACTDQSKTPCVMLFSRSSEKRDYKIYGQ